MLVFRNQTFYQFYHGITIKIDFFGSGRSVNIRFILAPYPLTVNQGILSLKNIFSVFGEQSLP